MAITLTSLVLWTGWNYSRDLCHPFADLSCGFFTDHFSHVALTRIATEVGPEIYLTARANLGAPLSEAERAALPEDVRSVPDPRSVEGWPKDKPFTATWLDIPSFYPPGELLVFAPPAAIYSFTNISFTESNRLTIQFLLVYAHLAIYLMIALSMRRVTSAPEMVVALVFAYAMVIHWTLEGFYEGAWIAPLLLTPFYLDRKESVPALVTFSMGAFAHFRALFYLPWATEGLFRFAADRQWRPWTRQKIAALVAAGLMGGASLVTFLILADDMSSHRKTNPFNPGFDVFDRSALIALIVVVLVTAVVFVAQRAWRELVMVVWASVLITLLPEVNHWEGVALVPWLLAPVDPSVRAPSLVRQARVAAIIVVLGIVFPQSIQFEWIKTAIGQLT